MAEHRQLYSRGRQPCMEACGPASLSSLFATLLQELAHVAPGKCLGLAGQAEHPSISHQGVLVVHHHLGQRV